MIQDIGRIQRNIDWNIPDNLYSQAICIVFQALPLFDKKILADLMKIGRIRQLLRHKLGIARKPMRIFRKEGKIGLFLIFTVVLAVFFCFAMLRSSARSGRKVGKLIFQEKPLFHQSIQVNKIGVSRKGGKTLVRRVPVACRSHR